MRKIVMPIVVALFMIAGGSLAQAGSPQQMNQMKPAMAKKDTSMIKSSKGKKMSSMKSMKMKKPSEMMKMKSSKKDSTMIHSKNKVMKKDSQKQMN